MMDLLGLKILMKDRKYMMECQVVKDKSKFRKCKMKKRHFSKDSEKRRTLVDKKMIQL